MGVDNLQSGDGLFYVSTNAIKRCSMKTNGTIEDDVTIDDIVQSSFVRPNYSYLYELENETVTAMLDMKYGGSQFEIATKLIRDFYSVL